MAEVTINIKAVDQATPVAEAVEAALGRIEGGLAKALTLDAAEAVATVADVELRIRAIPQAVALAMDTSQAVSALGALGSALGSLDTSKALSLDASGAMAGADAVRAAIDSIPDVTYKSVIIEYKTKASPVRPFSEGMEHIRQAMRSLPDSGEYTVNFRMPEAGAAPGASVAARPSADAQRAAFTFAPAVNISIPPGGGAPALAAEIDRELAALWSGGRSELRRAARSW